MSSTSGCILKDKSEASVGINEFTAPITAAFSPTTLSNPTCAISENKKRTIIIHHKTPLLNATPPEIIRALSYSHFFLLPLNKIAGLVTWTSGEPWESFLLVAAFWATILYGDQLLKYFGPFMLALALVIAAYFRRYSYYPLDGKPNMQSTRIHSKSDNIKHQKSLDEVVEALRVFTYRCHILIDPFFDLIDTITPQRTPIDVLIRFLLTTILPRVLILNLIWIALGIQPFQFITTKKILLVTGTLFLTWHSHPNRVTRAVLWRSSQTRRICSAMTGLPLTSKSSRESVDNYRTTPECHREKSLHPNSKPSTHSSHIQYYPDKLGVRFTFVLYENQRKWVGLGWTNNLFDYERSAWTDEYLNPAPAKEDFEFPDTKNSNTNWKWVEGSKWLVEGAGEIDEERIRGSDGVSGGMGWIYYDNKWQNGRRGLEGWGCYTRRRKWFRDAELIENCLTRLDKSVD